MSRVFDQELSAAQKAAETAAAELLRLYQHLPVIADAPADISLDADRRSQEIILQYLAGRFPEDAFVAEEDTPTLTQLKRSGSRLWVIDPIDGTRGFAKKNGEFSVMVALVQDGVIEVGVVHEPAWQRQTYASRGQGCWVRSSDGEPKPCRVSHCQHWSKACLIRSHSEADHHNGIVDAAARRLYTYSAGIKLARVARGEAEAYTSDYVGFSSWDIAAGQILVEEAGGRVTDGHGHAIRYPADGLITIEGVAASNGLLHDSALAAIGWHSA